jgi:hypothetical protein
MSKEKRSKAKPKREAKTTVETTAHTAPMATSTIKRPLTIVFKGDVFTVYFEINNREVTLHADADGSLKKTFEDFPPGRIDVLLHVKGLNTTAWSLTMSYKGNAVLEEQGAITKGFSHLEQSVELA